MTNWIDLRKRVKPETAKRIIARWVRTSMVFLIAMAAGSIVLTSCEEDDDGTSSPGWNWRDCVLGKYTHETQAMYAIPEGQFYTQAGSLPFLETGRDSFGLEGMMLVVPGRALEEGVAPSEMMAVFPVSEQERPVHIPEGNIFSKKSSSANPMWWSFSGPQFFPNDVFVDDQLGDVIGSWVPESMEDLQILVYNGSQDPGKLFGDTDWSEQAVEMGTTIESEKEQLAVAVPFDRLSNFNLELNFNLAEVIQEDPAKIDFPVEKGFVDPKPTASFFSGITLEDGTGSGEEFGHLIGPNRLGENGFNERLGQVTMIDGRNFFPDDLFTPSRVSVFTIPVNELFPDDLFMPYEGSSDFGESRLLLFGSDAFSEAPNTKWTHHQPGEEMDVSQTRVILPNSILAAEGGGTAGKAILPPARRVIGSSDGETFFPDDLFYPDELKFPDDLFLPEERFHFTRPEASYAATAIQEMGRQIEVSQ